MKALAACSEFACGECPYQYLDDKVFPSNPLKCINTLVKDTHEMLKGEMNEKKNTIYIYLVF